MKALEKLWWWGGGEQAFVWKKMALEFGIGGKAPDRFGVFFERAAFKYELEARITQKKKGQSAPVYRFQKPFPKLSQDEKDALKTEFPSNRWRPLPWQQPSSDPQPETPPPEYTDVHFWVNLETMSNESVHEAVEKLLNAERKRQRKPARPNAGRRKARNPWGTIKLIDRMLAGEELPEHEKKNATNLLNRFEKQ